MTEMKKPGVSYGSGFVKKLRPRHVATVAANETRMLFSDLIIPRTKIARRKFDLWGVPTEYFLHKYNTTWRNERAVELAAAAAFLAEHDNGSVLEFGNVCGHYGLGRPDVIVDLYERGDRITNTDIVNFSSDKKFDNIISISTIEHVGWDEAPRSESKTKLALDVLLAHLAPNGRMFITAPTGHNPYLDDIIKKGLPNTQQQRFYLRNGFEWTAGEEFVSIPYGTRGPGAASIWIAVIGSTQQPVKQ